MNFKKSQFIWMALFFLLIVVLFLGVISNSNHLYKINTLEGSQYQAVMKLLDPEETPPHGSIRLKDDRILRFDAQNKLYEVTNIGIFYLKVNKITGSIKYQIVTQGRGTGWIKITEREQKKQKTKDKEGKK